MVRGSCPVCHPSWVVTLVLQNLIGVFVEPLRTYECAVLLQDALFILASASAGRLGCFHAMSFPGSLPWRWVVVSFTFVTGFVTNIQAPPLLLGLQALLYRPNQRETLAMGDCYFLCGRSRVPGPLWLHIVSDASGSLFAARCNRKELSKTSVSFWLRMPLSQGSCLSATGWSVSFPLCSKLSCYRSVSSL